MNKKLIGELLIENRLISEKDLAFAMHERHQNEPLFSALLRLGILADNTSTWDLLAAQIGVIYGVPGRDFEWDSSLTNLLDSEIAQNFKALPLSDDGVMLKAGFITPTDLNKIEILRVATNRRIQPVLISQETYANGLHILYKEDSELDGGIEMKSDLLARLQLESIPKDQSSSSTEDKEEEENDGKMSHIVLEDYDRSDTAPALRLLQSLLNRSIETDASDIHVEPSRDEAVVRFRIDGVLHEITRIPKEQYIPFLTTIKVQSDMNIAERRLPQDGRFSTINKGVEVDFRVSTLPTVYGEKLVMRLLRRGTGMLRLDRLGLDTKTEKHILSAIANTSGIVLITGPTGSGKSTTLYSVLRELDLPHLNVITIEDPVEYNMAGITQVNVHPEIGLSFASVLRTVLRQDPDVVMLGEIRDQETAEIAIRGAQTGHLVLSTLHTNSASATLDRLLDMDIPPYLLASSLRFIGAQRLVRRICPSCKEPYTPSKAALNLFSDVDFTEYHFVHGTGCPKCSNTGFQGRMALLEYLIIEDELVQMIGSATNSALIKDRAKELGFYDPISRPGLAAVKNGDTTIEELAKVLIHG